MAEGGNPNTVGEINVGVGADISGLQAGLGNAKREVDQFAAGATKGTERVTKSFGGFGASLKALVAPLRSLRQGIQSVLSATIGWTGTIGLAVGALAGMAAALKAAADSISGWGAAIEGSDAQLKRATESYLKLIDKIETAQPQLETPVDAESLRRQVEELEKLNKRVEVLRASLSRDLGPFFEPAEPGKNKRALEKELRESEEAAKRIRQQISGIAQRVDPAAERELALLRAKNDELRKQERLLRAIREQSKLDITGTTVAAGRFGAALDLLQRQRTGGSR